MEESLKAAEEYKVRANKEIREARAHLEDDYLESAASTAYYSCFYAIHSRLARLGVVAKSHKQTAVEFRRHFIRAGKMEKKYSLILSELLKWRLTADYIALPIINKEKAEELVAMAEDFVKTLLLLES